MQIDQYKGGIILGLAVGFACMVMAAEEPSNEAKTEKIGPPPVILAPDITNVVWNFETNYPMTQTLVTNLGTNWTTVEVLQVLSTNLVRAKQVGTILTNRAMVISYKTATNHTLLL